MQPLLSAPATKRFTIAPLLLPLALWVLALVFAPLPRAISPLFSFQEAASQWSESPVRWGIAAALVGFAAFTLWQRRSRLDALYSSDFTSERIIIGKNLIRISPVLNTTEIREGV